LGGVVAVMSVELTTETLVAGMPPKVTVAGEENPEPVMLTSSPPAEEPLFGDTEKMLGCPAEVLVVVPLP
jgi:hypothetical protein